MKNVTVVDYGIGNLLSVVRALEACGATVTVTSEPEGVLKADSVLVPGVGAFADGMAGLRERNLVEPIREFAATGRPLLGICLGMQLLLDESEEFGGEEKGLGLIPGKVVAIPAEGPQGRHKIPHIGWNALDLPKGRANWDGTVLQGTTPGDSAYFVHSFTAAPADPRHRLADCDYDGITISAAVQRDNISGTQFHPEKSATTGLRIVANFVEKN